MNSFYQQRILKTGVYCAQKSSLADEFHKEKLYGEDLYSKIMHIEPSLAGKITGMFLEFDDSVIRYLLRNEDILRDAVERALFTLETNGLITRSIKHIDERHYCGLKLYPLVRKYCSDSKMASKVTGMLLEQDHNLLKRIIINEDQLAFMIHECKRTLENELTKKKIRFNFVVENMKNQMRLAEPLLQPENLRLFYKTAVLLSLPPEFQEKVKRMKREYRRSALSERNEAVVPEGRDYFC